MQAVSNGNGDKLERPPSAPSSGKVPVLAPVPPHHAMFYSALPPPPKRTATPSNVSVHYLSQSSSAPHQRRRRKGARKQPATATAATAEDKPSKSASPAATPFSTLAIAVALWYCLGVISISTSKVLLTPHHLGRHAHYEHVGGVPPLALTLQQLFIGSVLLRFLLENSRSVEPWHKFGATAAASDGVSLTSDPNEPTGPDTWIEVVSLVLGMDSGNGRRRRSHRRKRRIDDKLVRPYRLVVAAAAAFCLGFSTTNCAFGGASAAFVETVKAAEPITSAALAVYYRLDVLRWPYEVASLASIVAGVVLSTLGNSSSKEGDASALLWASIASCAIVMTTNLCFSVRGILQKMYRGIPTAHRVDDWNWQMRMQQLGAYLLAVPVLLWDGPRMLRHIFGIYTHVGLWQSGVLWRYIGLSLVNGIAFTSYNLASTFLLSRISVVHHAALNCLRRIFAIVVTSIVFRIPITLTGAFGILVSLCGFLSFTYFKSQRSASGTSFRGLEKSPSSLSTNGDAKMIAQP